MGQAANLLRAGGDTWITGSYDPDLNLTYWGVAQAKPWMRASRNTNRQRALYQLDPGPESGRREAGLVLPACARRIARPRRGVRARVGGFGRPETGVHIGKAGMLWKLDRQTGKFVADKETVYQNVFDRIDRRRAKCTTEMNRGAAETWVQACPSTEGGHNWQAMSYHPGTDELIIPLSQSCMEMSGRKSTEGRIGRHRRRRFFEMPGSNGNVGKLAAYART